MGKAARRRRTDPQGDPALDYLAMFDARNQFLVTTLSIGWRLAIMILLPVFIGVQIDKKLDSAPSATLAAFFLALFGAGMLISRTYREINAQAELEASKQRRKKVRRAKNV